MNKIISVVAVSSVMFVSGLALANGCCDILDSQIQQHNAYGPGQHMDQYGQNVTIQPRHSNSGSDPFNRIEKQDAYGPGIHMDRYGRPATVQPQHNGMGSSIYQQNSGYPW